MLKKKIPSINHKTNIIFVLAALVAIFITSLAPNGQVLAKPASGMSSREKNRSYSYFYSLSNCIKGNRLKNSITSTDTAQDYFKGWPGDTDRAVGFIIAADDGLGKCGEIITNALSLWGFSKEDFLDSLGYSLNQSGDRYTTSLSQSQRDSRFRTAVKDRVYGGNAVSMSDLDRYNMILATVANQNACNATDLGLQSGQTEAIQRLAANNGTSGGNTFTEVTKLNGGKAENHIYQVANSSASNMAYYYTRDGTSSASPNDMVSGNCSPASTAAAGNSYIELTRLANLLKNTDAGANADEGTGGLAGSGDEEDDADSTSSCAVGGVGWIVCPALGFIGEITDAAFSFLANSFLVIRPDYLSESTIGPPWKSMRNIANVLFIIAFLVIIYSQMTGVGVSNYGIKRLLPKLIIAAVLVNLSIYICQIAVDLSNILGYSLKGLFDNNTIFKLGEESTYDTGRAGTTGGGGAIAIAVAAGIAGVSGVALFIFLGIATPVLIAAVVAIFMILLILFARIALIILLTVVSPIAFVAYLLPNTNQWFKKWYKTFFALLMVFPVIGLVFGASAFAAGVVQQAGADGDQNWWADGAMLQIISLGIAAVPLFLVPGILKKSLDSAGSIGAKLSGVAAGRVKAVGARTKDSTGLGRRMEEYKSAQARRRQAGAIKSRTNTEGFMGSLNRTENRLSRTKGGRKISKYMGSDRGAILSNEASDKMEDEEVDLQQKYQKDHSTDQLHNTMNDKNESTEARAAAAGLLAQGMVGNEEKGQYRAFEDVREQMAAAEEVNDKEKIKVLGAMQKVMAHDSKSKPFGMSQKDFAAMREGKFGMQTEALDEDGNVIKDNNGNVQMEKSRKITGAGGTFEKRLASKLDAEALAALSDDELKMANKMAGSGQLSGNALQSLVNKTQEARNSPTLKTKISSAETKGLLDDIGAAAAVAGVKSEVAPSGNSAPKSEESKSKDSTSTSPGGTTSTPSAGRPLGQTTRDPGTVNLRGGEAKSEGGLIIPRGSAVAPTQQAPADKANPAPSTNPSTGGTPPPAKPERPRESSMPPPTGPGRSGPTDTSGPTPGSSADPSR